MPCTPLGCIELLDRTNTQISGRRAAVIGRSNIVGMPVALLLIKRNATVTLCHSATQNMEQVVREADIVIAAAGQAEMIKVGCCCCYCCSVSKSVCMCAKSEWRDPTAISIEMCSRRHTI